MDKGTPQQKAESISLHIDKEQAHHPNNKKDNKGCQREPLPDPQINVPSSSQSNHHDHAPEKKITLFALRLAILEKMASGLGTLGFIWATVVLLGGFAITLSQTDFWFITTILLIESTRIFSRSHELEWQHQATRSLAEASRVSFRALKEGSGRLIRAMVHPLSATRLNDHGRKIQWPAKTQLPEAEVLSHHLPARTWKTSDVPLLPYAGWVFLSKNISRSLYWLQLLSACACVCLSLMRLSTQKYGEVSKGDSDKTNRGSALNIFYGLALAEALLFLLEKAYWEWKISHGRLLEQVNFDCGFDQMSMVSIKRFFYDAYSKCVNGSIFDGLKMDLVTFATELMLSDSSDEQLAGIRILGRFSTGNLFSDETLKKLGTSSMAMDRLIELLNWKNPREEEIRKSAAEIISKLAGKKQNALKVAGIPGSIESISSLLENPSKESPESIDTYDYSEFNLLGLQILKELAKDHDNCGKIGTTRGLLPKIVEFTWAKDVLMRGNRTTESQIRVVKRSLQILTMLVSSTGITGKNLRHEISQNVFTLSNIREILQYGESYSELQRLGVEILTSLAMDGEAKEKIGGTGGILRLLASVYFKQGIMAAGEALEMLGLESEENCKRMVRLGVVKELIEGLRNPVLSVNSARVLRNLCAYGGSNCFQGLNEVVDAQPTVLKMIMSEETKSQEVAIGLAIEIFRFMDKSQVELAFWQSGVRKSTLAGSLVQILRKYPKPSIEVPRMRRFAIELAIWMMRLEEENNNIFQELGLKEELERVADTTSELECFNVFSGSVGISRHRIPMQMLVTKALELLGC
ncbi:uncharacterized protein LOC18440610 [Amborella trichopoda]|uniref:Armadillo repeat-containing domain-containing protein n=1 Tax=Amborella trichopoda TaxID=13333 RepID=W1PQT0_AMBTC|nr:uncharacterized protein LOC18440610 [Amborella trichopoda]ERN12392.1 hypothetical protein AMTR_s00025p00116370 [Amborella trichopoda]|eukprot:XP_006850811.1 uncharacterized protein LOC18440610 [Amborella trichopoda]